VNGGFVSDSMTCCTEAEALGRGFLGLCSRLPHGHALGTWAKRRNQIVGLSLSKDETEIVQGVANGMGRGGRYEGREILVQEDSVLCGQVLGILNSIGTIDIEGTRQVAQRGFEILEAGWGNGVTLTEISQEIAEGHRLPPEWIWRK